ncbi:MAG TPA: tRNA (adenosine(37)-N6)-threonylcarbamoyltransferase complex dimerization subunit type 1 TsaB [Propionibacteriaceae bacterium]|nr:tRNA (adenosine(37)-N6)-threonylcarbamoyltransferase complex dimerization subunit type 1 TsaB [Propionibacteriaceae bacterium]
MNQPITLALDTSTVVAAGLAGGDTVLASVVVSDRMQHVEQLMPLVQQALLEADLSLADVRRIIVGLGPGPFTGLRVGVATAHVLAAVSSLELRGVCTLDAIAGQYCAEHGPPRDHGGFVVATDARRKEVYWARYDSAGTRLAGPRVGPPEDVPQLPTIGPAADLYPDRLNAVLGPRRLDPGTLAATGWRLPDAGVEPLYLRRPDAAEPTRRKPVLLTRPGRPPQRSRDR